MSNTAVHVPVKTDDTPITPYVPLRASECAALVKMMGDLRVALASGWYFEAARIAKDVQDELRIAEAMSR